MLELALVSVDLYRARVGDIAKERQQQVVLALSAQAADTDQFPLAHAEADAVQGIGAQVIHFQADWLPLTLP